VVNLNDSGAGSLRQALLDANVAPDPDRVLFQSKLSGTVSLATQLPITGPTEVVGPGAERITVSGGGAVRAFAIEPPSGTPVSISGLTIADGRSFVGGGIYNVDAALTVSKTVLTGNVVGTFGGGAISSGGTGESLTLRDSTVKANTASKYGGGISASNLTIERSTITGNTTTRNDSDGAGVSAYTFAGDQLLIIDSTIALNQALTTGGGLTVGGPGAKTIVNTLIADNSAPEGGADFSKPPGAAPVTTSFSLIEGPGPGIVDAGSNLFGVDPKLAPLADNGGPTPTHSLRNGSPALDKGKTSGADQRGAPRPFNLKGPGPAAGGNSADIGAYERVLCGKILVNEVGTSGKDKLKGTKAKDGILGLGGKDILRGRGGKDGLCGGPGKDTLIGGGGDDTLIGGGGDDKEKQ
jgi:predicted outer membrane repeat protein